MDIPLAGSEFPQDHAFPMQWTTHPQTIVAPKEIKKVQQKGYTWKWTHWIPLYFILLYWIYVIHGINIYKALIPEYYIIFCLKLVFGSTISSDKNYGLHRNAFLWNYANLKALWLSFWERTISSNYTNGDLNLPWPFYNEVSTRNLCFKIKIKIRFLDFLHLLIWRLLYFWFYRY